MSIFLKNMIFVMLIIFMYINIYVVKINIKDFFAYIYIILHHI